MVYWEAMARFIREISLSQVGLLINYLTKVVAKLLIAGQESVELLKEYCSRGSMRSI